MKPYVVGCNADEFPDALETANRMRSVSNLRQVGQGLIMYADDHKGWLPPAVTDVARYGLPDYTFASPRTSTAMPRGELSPIEGSAWIRHLEDYVFLHLGERMLRLGREDVLGYENPDRVNGPITVLFADGHVEFVERAAAAALIGFPDAPPTNPPEPPEATGPQCVRDAGILGSATNLRSIANSLLAYANDHRVGASTQPTSARFSPPANWSSVLSSTREATRSLRPPTSPGRHRSSGSTRATTTFTSSGEAPIPANSSSPTRIRAR